MPIPPPVYVEPGGCEVSQLSYLGGLQDEVEHLRHTEVNKRLYARRKETIERVFADLKEKHGLRWTTLRGLKKVTMQAMLVFACMNLKKLANWLWKSGKGRHNALHFRFTFEYIQDKLPLLPMATREFVCTLQPRKRWLFGRGRIV